MNAAQGVETHRQQPHDCTMRLKNQLQNRSYHNRTARTAREKKPPQHSSTRPHPRKERRKQMSTLTNVKQDSNYKIPVGGEEQNCVAAVKTTPDALLLRLRCRLLLLRRLNLVECIAKTCKKIESRPGYVMACERDKHVNISRVLLSLLLCTTKRSDRDSDVHEINSCGETAKRPRNRNTHQTMTRKQGGKDEKKE